MSIPFDTLELRPELLQALAQAGFTSMTPIQAESLPLMLAGHDVAGQAQTGSGKTAAFALALLNGLDPTLMTPQAMVLCPTRELADQVSQEVRRLAQRLDNVRVMSVCGGRPHRDQVKVLARGVHVVVGTPGRIKKHLSEGTLKLTGLKVLVLDEADRMLDMGFLDDVTTIIKRCPKARQTLFFSATFSDTIHQLSETVQRDAKAVRVEAHVQASVLKQAYFKCDQSQRKALVVSLLAHHQVSAALVFCETRTDCDDLARHLTSRGALALSLHGQMEQRDRDEVLLQFANGSASVLVATNVAARGLDIEALPLVIIAELSREPEVHLHRIGRTARAGETGLALSIVCGSKEAHRLERIEALTGASIPEGKRPEASHSLHHLAPANSTLLILAGRKDKLRKGDILGALIKDGGLPSDAIGRIDVLTTSCAVAIARAHVDTAMRFLRQGRIKKKSVRVVRLGPVTS
ncbi:MAG: ATP-dependent RNA helicase DbpA [Verrucomicrobiales bacterium]|nr:ATP-dependent RNA helicase DbpA [Verrucomicrobiales bacterium]